MYRPPPVPRDRSPFDRPTWRSILAGYVSVAAFFTLLLIASYPLVGTLALAAIAGLVVAARHASKLIRCFYDCGGFSFDLGGRVRITVARPRIDDSN